MKCEFEQLNNIKGTSKIVKTNTVKKGSLVKNLVSDLGYLRKKKYSHNNVILINFKNQNKCNVSLFLL